MTRLVLVASAVWYWTVLIVAYARWDPPSGEGGTTP